MRRFVLPMLVCLLAAPARAGDFVDLRLSFNITDENVLVKPGETIPSIPGPRIGSPIPRWGTLFFDNYDTRFTGFENLTHLVLYKKLQQGADDFEGAFVLRFNDWNDNVAAIYDSGSYLKWTRWLDPTRASKTNVSVTAFPLSGDRMRLGYSYKISWGGSPIFFKPNPDNPYATSAGGTYNQLPAPGMRAQLATENAYAFLGLKTAVHLNKKTNQQESLYGLLGGGGWDVTPELRLEANGGYFYRGGNPMQEVLGARVDAFGASAQAVYHKGIPVGRSVDFSLYVNDPTSAARLFQPEQYPGGITWLASTEFTWTGQTLQDPDHSQTTVIQPAMAGDLNFRMKIDRMRLFANVMYRDLAFALFNVPSFVPFQAMTRNSIVTPELFGALGADYNFEKLNLTVGLTGGLQMPATFKGTLPKELVSDFPSEALPDSTTVVVRSEGMFDILPPRTDPALIFAAKLTGLLQLTSFNLVGEVLFGYDRNQTNLRKLNDDPEAVAVRVIGNPWQLGFNLAFQAKL